MGTSTKFLQVKEATVITPTEPTANCILPLSSLDSQPFLRFTFEYLLIYNNPSPNLNREAFTELVKSSLGQSVAQYYPLAGRVQEKVDGSGSLEVDCRAQGVAFIEAVSGYTRPDFEKAPRFVNEWRPLLCCHVDDVLKGDPPLVVQLTWLADGSVSFGFGFNHSICDGIGSVQFINTFADIVRGSNDRGVTPKPIWDRSLFDFNTKINKPKASNVRNHPEFRRVQDRCGFSSRFTSDQLVPTCNIFSKLHINELKRHASALLDEPISYTSFEVISAHIWRCWAKSLNMPSNQVIKLLFSVNFRNRIKPGLPKGYYGNGFVLGCAQTTVKELTENGLCYGSGLVKRAKERIDEKYVKEVVELVSLNRACPDSVGVLILSQWSRLGLERVDFGLGKPDHVGTISCDKYCILLPEQSQREAVRVMLAVPANAVDMYQRLLINPFS